MGGWVRFLTMEKVKYFGWIRINAVIICSEPFSVLNASSLNIFEKVFNGRRPIIIIIFT
jgi:hypothetical protein